MHVWNGNYWERPATKVPVPAPNTLTMLSDSTTLFGGNTVEFSAAAGARIYRWYASINNAPYEYIGLTTTNTFSKSFPAGSNKVKVIMDDCQSPKKSNEKSFAMGSISPSFGSLDGGNIIYIYGDFPYAATSEYAAQNNLVAHFDGINNRGLGDKQHDFTATASWKDLKSTFDLPRGANSSGKWLSNGFLVENENAAFYNTYFPDNFPAGTHERTVEVIFRTPDEHNMFTQEYEVQRRIFFYGTYTTLHNFGVVYRGLRTSDYASLGSWYNVDPDDCLGDNRWVFYPIFGCDHNLVTCLNSTPSLETPDTINTVTSTYKNSINDTQYTNAYINNTPAVVAVRMLGGSLNTIQGPVSIGENLAYSTFLSVRLYDRVLKSDEIEHNAALDQIRYLKPPSVTIGGKPCTEVVVLSPHFLMCRVPKGTTKGDNQVKLNGMDYTNYKYVDPDDDFYISSISPITGPVAGTVLTLKGNRLDEIDSIEVDGIPCQPPTTKISGEYKCTLPAHAPSEVDIVITTGGETYRFAKVFEYQ
jgi:hypothetical protein